MDADTMLVVATTLTQAPNDKQQVQPILQVLQDQAPKLGEANTLIADTGYCSDANVQACMDAGVQPLLSLARQDHHPHWRKRFTEPAPQTKDATPMQAMVHRLSTIAGRAPLMRFASKRWSRCLASSSRCWGSGSSRCAVCAKSPASGTWFAWPGMSSAWPYCVQKLDKGEKRCENDSKSPKSNQNCLFFKQI